MGHLSGHTSLETLDLGADERRLMNELWIESVEELVALRAAVGRANDVATQGGPVAATFGHVEAAFGAAGPYQDFQTPVPPGPFGYVLDDEAEQRLREMDASSATTAARDVFHAAVPASVRLMDKMPPVRDQGHRGTCVAFGVGALREYLAGGRVDLSEQFLYWACKEMDGKPNLPGTWLHIAMGALEKLGVCREEVWPYNPAPGPTEGQGPPPAGAKDDAKRYRLSAGRTVAPNQVMHFKHVLAGADGVPPMPVTIGTLVFDSWARSRATHLTGKITMPLPGERYVGGHAWCAVGYVDDVSVPGGGYFIIRNSWGTSWAAQSPEAPGHALMPYAYVEQYCREAFTGPADHTPAVDDVPDDLTEYVRTLERDGEDLDHALLERGTRVLFNRHDWESYRQDSDDNRAAFRRSGYVWTSKARDRTWFPEPSDLEPASARAVEGALERRRAFTAAMVRSLAALPGKPFPPVQQRPWWWSLRTRPARIRRAGELVADLTPLLVEREKSLAGVPTDARWPESWRRLLLETSELKVFAVDGPGGRLHVATVMSPGIRFQEPGVLRFAGASEKAVVSARELVSAWTAEQRGPRPFIAYVVALDGDDPGASERVPGHVVIGVRRRGDGRWDREELGAADRDEALHVFLRDLVPRASEDLTESVRRFIDSRRGYAGNLFLGLIADELSMSEQDVLGSVLALQRKGPYCLYATDAGERAVAPSRERAKTLGKPIRAVGQGATRLLTRFLIHVPTIASGVWLLNAWSHVTPFVVAVPFGLAYMGEWVYGRVLLQGLGSRPGGA